MAKSSFIKKSSYHDTDTSYTVITHLQIKSQLCGFGGDLGVGGLGEFTVHASILEDIFGYIPALNFINPRITIGEIACRYISIDEGYLIVLHLFLVVCTMSLEIQPQVGIRFYNNLH